MRTTNDRNRYGAQVNFDLCSDSGAATAFLDPSGVGLAVGTATKVSCSQWRGSNHYGRVPRRALEVLEIDGEALEERDAVAEEAVALEEREALAEEAVEEEAE